MKKLYLLLLLFIGWVPAGRAQSAGNANVVPTGEAPATPPSRWQAHADSIFQHINRSLVSTGLLTNYGFALKDYNQFQGTALGTANLLQNLSEWRLLYGTLQTSVFNGNATLPTLRTANLRIRQADQQAPDVVSIATLLARYDRFANDAVTSGLVTVNCATNGPRRGKGK